MDCVWVSVVVEKRTTILNVVRLKCLRIFENLSTVDQTLTASELSTSNTNLDAGKSLFSASIRFFKSSTDHFKSADKLNFSPLGPLTWSVTLAPLVSVDVMANTRHAMPLTLPKVE